MIGVFHPPDARYFFTGPLVIAFLQEPRGDINPLTFINRRRTARELPAKCVLRRAFAMPNITWVPVS